MANPGGNVNTVHDPITAHAIDSGGDEGFGLVEILVSMMLLAILAVALVPILIQGLQQAASNATLATATQLANNELERARSWKTCSALDPGSLTITDAREVDLSLTTTVGSCAPIPENPVSVPVHVTVTRLDTGVVVTSTTTYLFIAEP